MFRLPVSVLLLQMLLCFSMQTDYGVSTESTDHETDESRVARGLAPSREARASSTAFIPPTPIVLYQPLTPPQSAPQSAPGIAPGEPEETGPPQSAPGIVPGEPEEVQGQTFTPIMTPSSRLFSSPEECEPDVPLEQRPRPSKRPASRIANRNAKNYKLIQACRPSMK